MSLAASGLECVVDLGIPQYTYLARRSLGGDVTAYVRVGKHGKVASIRTPGADVNLAKEVELGLRYDTTYLESCKGQEVDIVFTFRLEGEPEDDPSTHIRFLPPNHFVLISHPRKPIIDVNH
ncbi:MAG TPA: hypothetical protein VKG25_23360 [Bryobacteraceae bacterium]|nr:hypothetical protein [Bryobacteraceae bacterium]